MKTRHHTQMRFSKHVTTACAAALSLGLIGSAQGQYALGGGDRLDANPSRVTGRSNLPAAVEDFRARNLTVTGDVAGGRAFRGEVGYTAAGDFRGRLSGDDTFRFRADSAYSSPVAIQTLPDQFRFGQQLGVVEYRRGGPAASPTQAPMQDGRFQPLDFTEGPIVDRIRMDELTRDSASAQRDQLDGRSRTVGAVRDEEGRPFFIEASSLRGIGYTSAVERYRTQGLTVLDRIRLRDDIASGRETSFGQREQWQFEQLLQRERLAEFQPSQDDRQLPQQPRNDFRDERMIPDSRNVQPENGVPGLDLEPRQQRQAVQREQDERHLRIMERIARRYAESEDVDLHVDPNVIRQLDDEFASLRDRLTGTQSSRLTDRDADRLTDPLASADRTQPEPEEEPQEDTDEQEPPQRPDDGIGRDIDPQRAVPMLRHGQRVGELTGAERTRFNELMEMAEENLRDGEYFLAEQQFLRALRFHPGEPLATAGMAHAQMGAGLHIAASLTLQRLFSTNPEMIDVQYEPELLPSRARLTQVIDTLRGRLDERRDRDAIAFLLAYIGHQMDDSALINQGLDIMGELREDDDVLLTLLEGIWRAEPGAEPQK